MKGECEFGVMAHPKRSMLVGWEKEGNRGRETEKGGHGQTQEKCTAAQHTKGNAVGNVSPGGWDPERVNSGKMVEGTDSGQDPCRRCCRPSPWFSKSYIQAGYLVLCVM
jgi:hypothetical protein